MTVVGRISASALARRWRIGALAAAVSLLAAILYVDRLYDVGAAFPLKNHPTPPLIAFLMLGTLCFPLGALAFVDGLCDRWLAAVSASWPTVKGKVQLSEVVMTLGKGPRFIADIRYDYEVEGRRYHGYVAHFSQSNYRYSAQAQEVVNRYPLGSEVAVRYDPGDPRSAVLDSSPSAALHTVWFGLGALMFPFLGFLQPFRDILNG